MPTKSIRVALVGIGNCASSFVQGLTFYKEAPDDEPVPTDACHSGVSYPRY